MWTAGGGCMEGAGSQAAEGGQQQDAQGTRGARCRRLGPWVHDYGWTGSPGGAPRAPVMLVAVRVIAPGSCP